MGKERMSMPSPWRAAQLRIRMALAGLGSDTVASPRPKNRAAGRVQHSQEGPHPLAPPLRRPRGLPRSGGSHVQRATPNRSSRRQGTARRAGAPHGSAPPGTRTCRPTAATSTSLGNGGAPSATTRRGTLLQASGCPSSGAISGHRHRPPHAGSIASPPPPHIRRRLDGAAPPRSRRRRGQLLAYMTAAR